MADKKKEKGSLLSAALVATPTAVGAALTVKGMLGSHTLSSSLSSASAAMKTLEGIAARRPPVIPPAAHILYMNSHASYLATEAGAEAARLAFLEAVKAADPLAAAPLASFTATLKGIPSSQVASAITDAMSKHSTPLTIRLFSKYYRNLGLLMDQQGVPKFLDAPDVATVPGFRALPEKLSHLMSGIENAIGAQSTYAWLDRPNFEHGIGSWSVQMTKESGARIDFLLPATEGGTLVEGATLRTRYIAPDVGIYDPATGKLERMTRSEFFLKEITESVVPDIKSKKLKTVNEIGRAIREARTKVIHSLETVPNLPMEQQTEAMQDYIRTRSQAIDIVIPKERHVGDGTWRYTSAYREPSAVELSKVMAEHHLYGGTSPNAIASGRVQTIDISQRYMVPEAVTWGRRPETIIREWGLTKESAMSMSAAAGGRYGRYRAYEAAAGREMEGRLLRPNLKTLYLDPNKYAEFMSGIGMQEGEAIARRGLSKYMKFETIGRVHLSTLREDLAKAMKEGQGLQAAPGEIIGWTHEGDPFFMRRNMSDLSAIAHKSTARGSYYTLNYRDVRGMTSADKFFGDIKALVHLMDTRRMRQRIQEDVSSYRFFHDTDIIASMDELRKDTSGGKHTRQIISALGEVMAEKANKTVIEDRAARLFYANPETVAKMWTQLATKEGVYSHETWVREAMKFAVNRANVTARQFGAIFGATGAVIGEEAAIDMVKSVSSNAKFLEEMRRGFAGGIAKVSYGGPAEVTGAGAMGSLEPRAFEILKGPAFGAMGEPLSEEFAQRLAYTNPEKLRLHRELSRTLASMAGEEGAPIEGAAVWKSGQTGFTYSEEEFNKFIRRGGGYITPGPGMRNIYVPGSEALQAMRPFSVGGVEIDTKLADIYHTLASGLDTLHTPSEPFDNIKAKQTIETAARELWKHAAPGGKGMGSVLRGHMEGSRFFRGVSRIGSVTHLDLARQSANAMVVGLPRTQAEDMFREMERMYGYEKMTSMRERFEAGKEIGGVLARHPFIGEYSMQPVRFKSVEGPGTQMIIPEISTNVRARLQSGDLVEKKLSLGPLIGLAGDKDADIYSAMMVSPDNEGAVRRLTLSEDSAFLRRYQQHQVRYQLLKAGRGAALGEEAMTISHLMRADVQKLGTVQRWVPKLSVELSAAKRAVRGVATGEGAADAMMLLEWLEQTPISAKHLSASEAEKGFEATLSAITSSLQYRQANTLQNVVETIVKDDAVAKELLTGNVSIESGAENIARVTGGGTLSRINGVNIRRATEVVMSSMTEYAERGEARRAELLAGRGAGLTLREIPEVVAKGASHMASGMQGMFASVSRAATAASNFMAAAGRSGIRNYKPLAIGFAASLGVAAALSKPMDIVGPGNALVPQGKIINAGKAADRMKPEDLMPPQQPLGTPTAPNMLAAHRALVAPNASSKYVVNATIPYNANGGALAGAISNSGIRGNVNVNLRDSRQIYNRHIAANRIS